MNDAIQAIKEELELLLNSSAFSTDSVEGWLLIILGLCLVHAIWTRAIKAAGWLVSGILLFQCLYSLSLTGFNNLVPLDTVFKYDVLTSIAQCFVGTRVCDVLLWLDSFLIYGFSAIWDNFGGFMQRILHVLAELFNTAKDIG